MASKIPHLATEDDMTRRINPFRKLHQQHPGKFLCLGYSPEAIRDSILSGSELRDCAGPNTACLHDGRSGVFPNGEPEYDKSVVDPWA